MDAATFIYVKHRHAIKDVGGHRTSESQKAFDENLRRLDSEAYVSMTGPQKRISALALLFHGAIPVGDYQVRCRADAALMRDTADAFLLTPQEQDCLEKFLLAPPNGRHDFSGILDLDMRVGVNVAIDLLMVRAIASVPQHWLAPEYASGAAFYDVRTRILARSMGLLNG